MSITAVPARIYAGPTCYIHFTRGKRDLYAPDFMMPAPPLAHTWRYGVASSHGNTVFFCNEESKKSIWVLPIVDSVTGATRPLGDDEAMRAEGKKASAKANATAAASAPEKQKEDAEPRETSVSSTSSDAASDRVKSRSGAQISEAVRNRERAKREIEESVKNALIAKASEKGADSSSDQRHRQLQSESGEQHLSVQERLAAYRARKDNTSASAPADVHHAAPVHTSHADVAPTHENEDADGEAQSSQRQREATEALDLPSETVAQHRPKETTNAETLASFVTAMYAKRNDEQIAAAEAVQRERIATLKAQQLAYERQQRRQAEEEAEEEERLRMLRARRLAEQQRLERARSAQQAATGNSAVVDHGGADISLAVDAINAFFSKQQSTVEKAESEEKRALSLEETISQALNDRRTPAPVSHSAIVADRRAAPPLHREAETTRRGQITVHSVRYDDRARHRDTGEIAYGPEFRYMGDLSTSGGTQAVQPRRKTEAKTTRNAVPFLHDSTNENDKGLAALLSSTEGAQELPIRDGQGTMRRVINISQKGEAPSGKDSFFKGTWIDDERNGKGVLSLPNTVLEGEWRDDALVPNSQCLLQTRRLKGTLTSAPATTSHTGKKTVSFGGPAMLQLDNGARVAGVVTPAQEGHAPRLGGGPSALHLPSRDRVEWWPEEGKERGTSKKRPTPAPSKQRSAAEADDLTLQARATAQARGTGKCRVHFHNGDVYTGSVANFELHGYGCYQFHETGNRYVGFFYRGVMQGEGTYSFADGDVYIGTFLEGAFHGVGCYLHKDAYVYEGEWHAGQMHGKGILTFANGDQWKGTFDKDERLAGKYVQFNL